MSKLFLFGNEHVIDESYDTSEENLGIRGASLMRLNTLPLPLAPGFIYSQEDFKTFKSDQIKHDLKQGISAIEEKTHKKFGDSEHPLFLKVVVSPSIHLESLKSVHHIGLNQNTIDAFAKQCGEDVAYSEYIQLIEGISVRFLNYDISTFIQAKQKIGVVTPKKLCEFYIEKVVPNFPQDPMEQLFLAVSKMKHQYFSDTLNQGISAGLVVQMMVYGNFGKDCYNGVYFSRNLVNGKKEINGYFGKNEFWTIKEKGTSLAKLPSKYLQELESIGNILEENFCDIHEIYFVIEQGKVWLLSYKNADQKSTQAELRMLLDLNQKNIISETDLVERIPPSQLNDLLHPIIDEHSTDGVKTIEGGIAGSPGAAQGFVYFSTKKLLEAYQDAQVSGKEQTFILAMKSTYAEDVQAIELGQAVISSEGGYASHAPVVARSLGKPALVNPEIHFFKTHFILNGQKIKEGDYISIETPVYETPKIYLGKVNLVYPDIENNGLHEFMDIVSKYTDSFQIRSNTDKASDALLAKKLGAQGIGLCRTEHMFFGEERIQIFRELILAQSLKEREVTLKKLKKFQKKDFKELFQVLEGNPITIRLLDAPLHEFLPSSEVILKKVVEDLKKSTKLSSQEITTRFQRLKEVNPMLGHRGCRIAISYPEIYQMQISAILEAAYEISTKKNIHCDVEIMIPLVMTSEELKFVKNGKNIEGTQIKGIKQIVGDLLKKYKLEEFPFEYKTGTMIELPAASLSADIIAQQAEFFSFGTNDLTQTTHGLSRDDINSFLPSYTQYDILEENPFQILTKPVQDLISNAITLGRLTRPDLKTGLCGEHGADPQNIDFCIESGLDYVSCSPYGVPLATLAVAQYYLKSCNIS